MVSLDGHRQHASRMDSPTLSVVVIPSMSIVPVVDWLTTVADPLDLLENKPKQATVEPSLLDVPL